MNNRIRSRTLKHQAPIITSCHSTGRDSTERTPIGSHNLYDPLNGEIAEDLEQPLEVIPPTEKLFKARQLYQDS